MYAAFMFQEWPFVKVDPYMVCAHCIAMNETTLYRWRGEILDMKCPKGIYYVKCPQNDVEVPACIVYPIDPGRIVVTTNFYLVNLLVQLNSTLVLYLICSNTVLCDAV